MVLWPLVTFYSNYADINDDKVNKNINPVSYQE